MVNSTASQLPTDVQFEKQLGQLSTFIRVMRQAGLPIEEAIQKPIDDPEMRKRLVRFWNSGGYEATTSQKLAREIMGKNYFGIEEAIQHFGVKPTKAQLSALAEIPLTEAELRECKDIHVLVAVFPLSILDNRGKVERKLFYSHEDAWYNNKQAFAKDKGEARWQLVRKTPVENSTNKTWSDQQALLAKNEETPTAQIMTYTIIGHFLSTGERLFENVYVRCSDLDSDGRRVDVGGFGSGGLDVSDDSDGVCYDILGLSSARKFN
jgi:hypothetical protein